MDGYKKVGMMVSKMGYGVYKLERKHGRRLKAIMRDEDMVE